MDAQAINQQANDTAIGIFVVIFAVFAIIIFSSALAVILRQRALKCPKCGNWKGNKLATQTVKTTESGKTVVTTQRIVICKKCKNEFTV